MGLMHAADISPITRKPPNPPLHATPSHLIPTQPLQAAGVAAPKPPQPNPLMLGLGADAYVLRAVGGVRANDLEQSLLLLPFNEALRLLSWASGWLAQGTQVCTCVRAPGGRFVGQYGG